MISATDRLFKSRPWAGPPARQQDRYERWLARSAGAYGIATPSLSVSPSVGGHGCYIAATNAILLPHFSVVTLLHEFRHALQLKAGLQIYADREEDARTSEPGARPSRAPAVVRRGRGKRADLFHRDCRLALTRRRRWALMRAKRRGTSCRTSSTSPPTSKHLRTRGLPPTDAGGTSSRVKASGNGAARMHIGRP